MFLWRRQVPVGRLPDAYYRDLERSCSSLEEPADVRFQVVVTPIGPEGIRLLLFLKPSARWQLRRGMNGGEESLVPTVT